MVRSPLIDYSPAVDAIMGETLFHGIQSVLTIVQFVRRALELDRDEILLLAIRNRLFRWHYAHALPNPINLIIRRKGVVL